MEEFLNMFCEGYNLKCEIDNGILKLIEVNTNNIEKAIDRVKDISRVVYGIEAGGEIIYNGRKI